MARLNRLLPTITTDDNIIVTSSVDASGFPNFLTAGAGLSLNINGGTTPLVLRIAGEQVRLITNVALTLTATSNQFIYATKTSGQAELVAASFTAVAIPPSYAYTAPAGPATGDLWFDLSTNLMKKYSAGATWVTTPILVIGVARTSGAAIDAVLPEPYRLTPYKRFEVFGNASDGLLTVTGSTTVDGYKQYSFVRIDGAAGSLIATANSSTSKGIAIKSQNPILLINSGVINVNGLMLNQTAGGLAAGAAGSAGGGAQTCGVGGGGGGAAAANAGGTGGNAIGFIRGAGPGGGAGGGAGVAGSNGSSANAIATLGGFTEIYPAMGFGGNGGNGGGDGANNGGTGGRGGGFIYLRAPSILIAAGSSITADGNVGGNGAGGDAGAGGGGGGGMAIVSGGFVSNSGTVSANGATGGTGQGGGKNGGTGGNGTALTVRLW